MLTDRVDDLRLIWAVGLNAAVFAAAYCFACRWTGSRSQALCDGFLGLFAVEYIAVCLPGVLHVLNAGTMAAVAVGCAGVLFLGGWKRRKPPRSGGLTERSGRWELVAAAGGAGFVLGYLGYVFCNNNIPAVATDPLVYHLPTAVWWLQHHSLAIYPTWYWNPAASYCPLSGSAFIAWLMAPMGDDVLARFVQFAPLLFIFCLVTRFSRLAGCSRGASAWVGAAAAMARPFFSEALIPKDDLFVAAFVGAAVLSAASENLRDRLGPWRCGVALGMVLASKYTVLLACPVLLFLIDAPVRARWRAWKWGVALGAAAILAGGWYLRNWIRFGDPLFPVDVNLLGHRIFTGLFGTERDLQLQSAVGVRRMIGSTYYSLPWPLIGLLAVGWAGASIDGIRTGSAWRDPLRRACILGAPAALGLFLLTSPHHEVRYLDPLLLLFFACAAMAITGWVGRARVAGHGFELAGSASDPGAPGPPRSMTVRPIGPPSLALPANERTANPLSRLKARGVAAAILAAASIATSFAWDAERRTLPIIGWALATAAIAGGIAWARPSRRTLLRGAGAVILVLLAVMYVYWDSYMNAYKSLRVPIWGQPENYPKFAGAWAAVEQLPADTTVAYANTYLVYPLYDFHLQRRVVYAPVRREVQDFEQLPRLGDAVPGDLIVQTMTRMMDADPDRKTWYPNLAASGADYLLVVKNGAAAGLDPHPPELAWARADPRHFEPVFEDADTVLYRIHYTSRW